MYIRECNRSIKNIHTDQPGFVIHILYEWLVIFISYFLENPVLSDNNNNSFFPHISVHIHNRMIPHFHLYIFRYPHSVRPALNIPKSQIMERSAAIRFGRNPDFQAEAALPAAALP